MTKSQAPSFKQTQNANERNSAADASIVNMGPDGFSRRVAVMGSRVDPAAAGCCLDPAAAVMGSCVGHSAAAGCCLDQAAAAAIVSSPGRPQGAVGSGVAMGEPRQGRPCQRVIRSVSDGRDRRYRGSVSWTVTQGSPFGHRPGLLTIGPAGPQQGGARYASTLWKPGLLTIGPAGPQAGGCRYARRAPHAGPVHAGRPPCGRTFWKPHSCLVLCVCLINCSL